MADISAIPQNQLLGRLAGFLRFLEKDRPEFLPSELGAMQAASKLMLPQASTVENLSYGNLPFTMPPSGTGAMIPQVKTGRKAEVADLVGMITGGVPGGRVVADVGTNLSNKAADELVRMITRNPQATAPAALEAASNMSPLARMFNPDEAKGLLDTSYRGSHAAPNREFGAPLFELNKIYPDDIYSPGAARLYGHGGDAVAMDKRTAQILRAFRGKPDAEVTIYRAVPKDKTIKDINAGDWVTINKDYAKQHGESVLRGDYKILERKVRAKDIWTNADSIHEFGYDPQVTQLSPKEIAKAAWEANPDNRELYEAYRKLRLGE